MPTPEELARQTIDAQLGAAGWVVQSLDELNLSAARGVAVREMRAVQLGLPPRAQQDQIVAEVEARTTAIDHLEAELDRQITRFNRLRQSTLAAAFSGNLNQPLQNDAL